MGPGDGEGGPSIPTPLLLLFGFFVLFCFLHSLLSIKKPFLQPAFDAHSLLLPVSDDVPHLLEGATCLMKSGGA